MLERQKQHGAAFEEDDLRRPHQYQADSGVRHFRAAALFALHPFEEQLRALARAGDDRTESSLVLQLGAETLEHFRVAARRAQRELVKRTTPDSAAYVDAVIQQIQLRTTKPIAVGLALDTFDQQLDPGLQQPEVDDRCQPSRGLGPAGERLARVSRFHRGLVATRRRWIVHRADKYREQTAVVRANAQPARESAALQLVVGRIDVEIAVENPRRGGVDSERQRLRREFLEMLGRDDIEAALAHVHSMPSVRATRPRGPTAMPVRPTKRTEFMGIVSTCAQLSPPSRDTKVPAIPTATNWSGPA